MSDAIVVNDGATPKLEAVTKFFGAPAVSRYAGRAALAMTKAHLNGLSGNKMGWPSQGFYQGAARGSAMVSEAGSIRISVENYDHPGAIKHQYNRGQDGPTFIVAGDHLLTIPARAEYYGHRAGEFTNLRFVMFKSGAKALVVGTGGNSRTNFKTGHESSKGIGKRTAGMVAYWLKDMVEQAAKPEVLPTRSQYSEVVKLAVNKLYVLYMRDGKLN